MLRWFRATFISVCVVVALCVPVTSSIARAAEDSPISSGASALTAWATTAVGQQQGECFPWVRRVVQTALGIVIGNDYRLGYLQAGAVEVTPQAARKGDIIQIANDANTTPSADYPGLHTALIVENEGGGRFKVVDSNSNFDGRVRVRNGYDPGAAAARYSGLSFHIYRLPEHASGASVPLPPASTGNTPGVIPIGSAAEIAADGDCLRVRTIAGLSGGIVGCLPTGMRVTVTQPGPDVDGYHWVTITNGAISGWASERYLRAVRALQPTPAASVAVPAPVPLTPRILSGVFPPRGIALIVFSGGTDAQLLAASGCPSETASFWVIQGERFVQLLPGVTIPIVNAEWRSTFPNGIPANTALMGRCRPLEAPSAPTPVAAPPTAAAAATTPSVTADPSSYTAAEGDSLSSVAERFHRPNVSIGVFLDALYEANSLTVDSILRVGQVLRLPN